LHQEGLCGRVMSDDIAVSVQNVSKRYLLYDRPQDRLKQSLFVLGAAGCVGE
jgi:hypothetical protein